MKNFNLTSIILKFKVTPTNLFKRLFSGLLFVFLIHVAILDFFFETSKYFATFFAENCTSFWNLQNDYFDQESSELLLSGKTFIDL